MAGKPSDATGPSPVSPPGRGRATGACPVRTLLITDTHPCLDGFVSRSADLGVAVLRRPGSAIPPWPLGDEDLVERVDQYVLREGVRDLIVCGHSRYTAWAPGGTEPAAPRLDRGKFFNRMLTRITAAQRAADRGRDAVLRQAENLCTYRSVHRGVALGIIRVHAWFYVSEVGSTLRYDPNSGWVPLDDGYIA
jgi:carbonic anhydrase